MQQPRLTIEEINSVLKEQGCKTFDRILETILTSHEQEPTVYVVSKTHRIKMKTVREGLFGKTKIPLVDCEKLFSDIIWVSDIQIPGVDNLYFRYNNHKKLFNVRIEFALTKSDQDILMSEYALHNLAMLDFSSIDLVCDEKLPPEVELIVEEINAVLHHPEWDLFLQYN